MVPSPRYQCTTSGPAAGEPPAFVVKAGSVSVYGESLRRARTQTGLSSADLRPGAFLPRTCSSYAQRMRGFGIRNTPLRAA